MAFPVELLMILYVHFLVLDELMIVF